MLGAVSLLEPAGFSVDLIGQGGTQHPARVDRLYVEECGAMRATLVAEGAFGIDGRNGPLTFRCRTTFFAGSATVRLEFRVRNPRAAVHPGGLWDLGDPGSVVFKDLSIHLKLAGRVEALRWYAESRDDSRVTRDDRWALYQDSSGGDNWASPNHIDANGERTVTFRGYEVRAGTAASSSVVASDLRATPCLQASSERGWVAATTEDFWQNFPKALRFTDGVLSVGLFPGEGRAPFELQGGEQKRQVVL
ncbi:MAG: hypothetical protein WB783_07975, partial [Arenicellales bacterium]